MDSKLDVLTSALNSIKKFGWCNIGDSHKDVLVTIEGILKQYGYKYSFHKHEVSTQLFITTGE